MFGNNDIYRSQADLAANSFTGPQNMNIGGPGWGMDSSMMTPSYTAPYRPQWAGQGGQYDYTKRGMISSMNKLMPWQDFGHTSPQDTWHSNVSSAVESPFDVAAFVVQRIAAPILAFKAANHFLGAKSFSGAFSGRGAGPALGKSIFRRGANGFLRGAGASATTAARVGVAAGVAGSAVGAVALPFAAAMGGLAGAERGLFNPYINNMKQAESIHQNFSGVTFADAKGSTPTGRGFSYKEAMNMSQDITKMGIRDMSLSTGEFKDLSDMSMRSGMLDNAKARDIIKRIKEISEQVKLVMAISKDPSVQGAIESLAKLQMGGAMGSKATSSYTQLGLHASIAGTSVQRLMDTVGAQGSMMYAQNGMTPYLGQMAAASAHSSFASANRMGLISSEQLARMGGIEGATQSMVGAQVMAGQTTLGKFMSFNKYIGSGEGKGVIGSVAGFGRSMAKDPTKTMGQMILYGNQASAKMMDEEGGRNAIEKQIMMIAKDMPNGIGSDGKVSAETAAVIMKNMMGLGDDQIQSFMVNTIAAYSKDVRTASVKGRETFIKDQMRTLVDQNASYGGVIGSAYGATLRGGRAATDFTARHFVDPVTETAAGLKDSLVGVLDDSQYGSTLKGKTVMADSMGGQVALGEITDLSKGRTTLISVNDGIIDDLVGGGTGQSQNKAFKKLNEASEAGDKEARAALDALWEFKKIKNPTQKDIDKFIPKFKDGLRKVVRGTTLEGDFMTEKQLLAASNEAMRHTAETRISSDKVEKLEDTVKGIFGKNDRTIDDNLQLAGDAQTLAAAGISAAMSEEEFSKISGTEEFKRLSAALGKTGRDAIGGILGINTKVQGSTLGKAFIDGMSKTKNRKAALEFSGGVVLSESSAAMSDAESAKAAKINVDSFKDLKNHVSDANQGLSMGSYEESVKRLDGASNTFAAAVNTFAKSVGAKADAPVSIPPSTTNQNSSGLEEWGKNGGLVGWVERSIAK